MRLRPLFVPVLSLAAVLGAFWGSGVIASSSRYTPPQPMIATVELEKLFNNLDELAAKNDEVKAYAATLKTELDKIQASITSEDDKRKLIPTEKAADRKAAAARIVEMQMTLKIKNELYMAMIDQRQAEAVRGLYEKIAEASKKISLANNFTLVLIADDMIPLPGTAATAETQRVISMKRMLYSTPAADITSELLTAMNNEYRAAGGKPRPPATSAPLTPPPTK